MDKKSGIRLFWYIAFITPLVSLYTALKFFGLGSPLLTASLIINALVLAVNTTCLALYRKKNKAD